MYNTHRCHGGEMYSNIDCVKLTSSDWSKTFRRRLDEEENSKGPRHANRDGWALAKKITSPSRIEW